MTRYRMIPPAPTFAPSARQSDYNDYIVMGRRLQAQAMHETFGRLARGARRLLRRGTQR